MPRHDRSTSPPGRAAVACATAALPGWLLLVGGVALVALAVLTPAWLDNERLAWQHQVLATQAEHLERQADRYDQLHDALASEDPVLLERLAFVELGLRPADRRPLLTPPPRHRMGGDHHFASDEPGGVWGAGGAGREAWDESAAPIERLDMEPESMRSVNAWPVRAMPQVGRELPTYQPPDTRLTRLTTGRSRLGLIAAGVLCLLAACYPGMWERMDAE